MSASNDGALLSLSENLVKADRGADPGGDQVAQRLTRPNGRKLIDIADQREGCVRRNRRKELRGEPDPTCGAFWATLESAIGVPRRQSRILA